MQCGSQETVPHLVGNANGMRTSRMSQQWALFLSDYFSEDFFWNTFFIGFCIVYFVMIIRLLIKKHTYLIPSLWRSLCVAIVTLFVVATFAAWWHSGKGAVTWKTPNDTNTSLHRLNHQLKRQWSINFSWKTIWMANSVNPYAMQWLEIVYLSPVLLPDEDIRGVDLASPHGQLNHGGGGGGGGGRRRPEEVLETPLVLRPG